MRLAEVATLSEFHFHRIYRLMTGEPVGETLRRIRLARAVPALQQRASVTNASFASGYSTPQGFARALRAQTGQTPTEARAQPELLAAALRRARPGAGGRESVPAMTVDIASVEPLRLLAIRNTGAYAELNGSYGRLFELVLEQLQPELITGLYGVQYDDPRFVPGVECRAWCAVDTGGQGVARGELQALTIGGNQCLRLRHRGDYDQIAANLDTLYAYAIDVLGQELLPEPPFIHFLDDPDQTAVADLRADLHLPLRQEAAFG